MDWRARLDREVPSITGAPDRDAEIREELAEHCRDRLAEMRRQGVDEAEAERRVMAEVGDLARRAGRREVSALPPPTRRRFAAEVLQDVRYAARLLRRAPGFTAGAVATLALAVAAVTSVFSVVDGVLLQPLPYPQPERLAYIWEVSPQGEDHNVVSRGVYSAWESRATSFETLAFIGSRSGGALTGRGDPRRVSMAAVAPAAFEVTRAVPAAGRFFSPTDGQPGSARVALVGHEFWTTQLGADSGIVGQDIVVEGVPYTVLGVLPANPGVPEFAADVVTPWALSDEDRAQFRSHVLRVIGRLAPGATFASAQAEMDAIAGALAVEQPADVTGWGVNVVPLHADLVRGVRPLLTLLMTVVVVVLLMACANLANLQLARVSGRGGELAVRAAIGAGRRRLTRQLLTESLTLAIFGGATGLLLAWWLTQGLVSLAPGDIPRLDVVAMDWRALGTALAATAGSAVLVGVLPALQISRANLQPLLHGGRVPSDARQGRFRLLLVGAQVALAFVLLVAAVLLTRSFFTLNAVEHGFDVDRLLSVELTLPSARYPDAEAHRAFHRELLDRLRQTPGITAAASTTAFAGEGAGMTFSYAIEGRVAPNPNGREDDQPTQAVAPGYFEAMGIPIVEGRAFATTDDTRGAPVVIVNEALAKRHWPGGSPLGARLSMRPGETPWLEVVGVVGDTRDEGLDQPPPPTLYLPYEQAVSVWSWMSWQNLVLRTTGDPEAAIDAVAAAVWSLDPELPLLDARSMASAFAENTARRRFAMQLIAGFAAVALLLGAVGIYGVLSYSVTERRREIGVRLALGARPAQVAGAILLPVLLVAASGVVVGIIAALAGTGLIASLLYGVDPRDPWSYAAVAMALMAVAAVAAWRPLRQAARLDPLAVLRE